MFGSILKSKEDVINDIAMLNEICQDYKEIKSKFDLLLALTNISSMTKCSCRDLNNKISFEERLHCDKCNGLGYVITYKANTEE